MSGSRRVRALLGNAGIRFISTNTEVRVRFAPSPTGELHLGGLRTALYNYLFAKKYNGKFILRLEDTDRTRLVPESIEKIHRIIDHYGLHVDEGPSVSGPYGPYVQSERLPIYGENVAQLLDSGHAYRCFCSSERLELLRKTAVKQNMIPKYDRRCRSLSKEESLAKARNGESFVVRFVMDVQDVDFKDEVFGDVRQRLDESDMILLKSDGFPTYHLANVVDDKQMKISHVIRGMEWLSSTGKHVSLYRAFGWKHPKWIHLSLITRDGKKKLSKRDKDAFVDYYEQDLGALPNAVLNVLIRNGSGIENFDANRLYSLEEMVDSFNVDAILRRNLQLDHDCLENSCRQAFRSAPVSELVDIIRHRLQRDSPSLIVSDELLVKAIDFLQSNEERFAYLKSLTSASGDFHWMLVRPTGCQIILENYDRNEAIRLLENVLEQKSWTVDKLRSLAREAAVSAPNLMGLVRLALIDSKKGPPIAELVSFFGHTECAHRIRQAVQFLSNRSE